ncbi:MAG: hypothetical protein NTW12_12555 [Deltaproteobacteria bacterium]|nr:hypothetical protein [Deltaproteobacteria bacterium]
MERIYNSKYSWLMSILLLLFVSAANGHTAGIMTEWEPFKIKSEFGLHVVGGGADTILFSREEINKMGSAMNIERDTTVRKDDSSWNVIKFRNVRISFTNTIVEQIQRDVKKTSGDGSDKLNSIKSLPATLLAPTNRESIESIGKIFEPQVNLGIEF